MTAVGSSVAAASLLTDYPIMGGQAARYALASLMLFVWARLVRVPLARPTARDLVWLTAVAFVGMAAFNVLLIAAAARTDPSLVGAVVGTAPVALAVLGALQAQRRPSVTFVAAAVMVAVGAAVVQQARVSGGGLATLLAVGAMLGEVGFSLLAVPVLRRLGAVAVSAHATWLAALMLAIGAVALDGPDAFRVPTTTELGALLYLAVVVTAVAFVLWYTAVDSLGADTAGLFAGLVPVSALVTSALIGTDELVVMKGIGAGLVGLGVVIGIRVRRRPTLVGVPEAGESSLDPDAIRLPSCRTLRRSTECSSGRGDG
jgi:drug/metabolite transporter (DMT)-like permease